MTSDEHQTSIECGEDDDQPDWWFVCSCGDVGGEWETEEAAEMDAADHRADADA